MISLISYGIVTFETLKLPPAPVVVGVFPFIIIVEPEIGSPSTSFTNQFTVIDCATLT